jgi:hypothetical protein
MANAILSMYGRDSATPQKPRASCGGECVAKELPYSPPVGPKGQWHQAPGLGDRNLGNKVMQGKH